MGSRFAGVEAEFRSDGCVFHLVIVKRSGKKLTIEKSISDISSSSLKENLPREFPCAIVFTGKGVLNRYVQAAPDSPPHALIGKILPNASAKDFYINATPSIREGQMVNVVRKESVNAIMNELRGFGIITSGIGPFIVCDLLRMLDHKEEIVHCGNHTIRMDTGFPSEVMYNADNKSSPDFDFGGEKISSSALIAFASAFQFAVNGNANTSCQSEITTSVREEYFQQRLFKASVKTTLAGTLLLLCVNYFMFSHYWKLQEELSANLMGQTNIISEVNHLEEQAKNQSEFLSRSGLLSQSSYAWYADQIAHSMPGGINLTRLNFSPRIKVANEDSIGFNAGTLEITGLCGESVVLNNWLQELKKQDWILSASIRSYQQVKTKKEGEFTLDLSLQ